MTASTHSKSTERAASTANGVVMLLLGLALLIGGCVAVWMFLASIGNAP